MSTAPPGGNPFPASNPYVKCGILCLVSFMAGVIAGQFAMGWALKPDSYTFPTYQLQMPVMEPDT
jgi:hypothetical protein